MRICESGEVIEILCGCFGCILYGSPFMRDILRSPCKEEAYRIPYVKYSTGANKTTRTVYRALGKPNQTAARRAFLAERTIGERHNAFSARQRYFASPAPFSSISFPARGKRYGPRSGGDGAPNSTAPSAHPNAEKSRPCGRLSIYLLSRASRLRGWRHRPSADAASLRPFPYGRRRSAYRRTGGPSSCAAAG